MKKNLMVNIIIVISFILLDSLLHFCAQWADTYNLGAEMVLGMVIPVIFAVLALAIICSIVYSFYLCVAQKNIKNIIPILVFVMGAIVYALLFNGNGLWMHVIKYYVAL